MKLTLKQIFERYPLKMKGVAERMGRSREWLSHIAHGYILSEKELSHIEEEINKLGSELAGIEILKRENNVSKDSSL